MHSRTPTWQRAIAAIAVAAIALVSSVVETGALPGTSPDPYEPVVESERDDVRDATAGEIGAYRIEATLDPGDLTVRGSLRFDFHNWTGETVDTLPFLLFPNAPYYDEGELAISDVEVDGEDASTRSSDDAFSVAVRLPEPLAAGDRTRLTFDFETRVPSDSTGSFGIFSFDTERGTWIMADWYPILAGWDPETGWRTDPPTTLGDPTYADVALYDVELRTPDWMTVVATGTEEAIDDGAVTTWRISTGPVREFTFVADDDYVSASAMAGETEITVYGNPGMEATLEAVAERAAVALGAYSDLLTTYPYTELDLVDVELSGAYGVSWTGIVFLDGGRFLSGIDPGSSDRMRFDFTLFHEVGHQWIGALVGVNSNDHPFMTEGVTNALVVRALEEVHGQGIAHGILDGTIAGPYIELLETEGDSVVDVPVSAHLERRPFSSLIYGKAALGLLAIREEIGDEAFDEAVARYVREQSFRNADPDDLLDAFEDASGQDIEELWELWFESAGTTPVDVYQLLDEIAERDR